MLRRLRYNLPLTRHKRTKIRRSYQSSTFTIPNGVTRTEIQSFESPVLTSVTFQGTITSIFGFYGDLRTKYLADNGGIGMYTTTSPVSSSSVWTKS